MIYTNQTPERQKLENHFRHLHPLPLFTPLDEEEERHDNLPEWRIWKQGFFREEDKQFLP